MRRLLANPNDSLKQKISSRQTFLQKEQSNHLYTKTESSLEKLESPCLGSQVAPAYKLEPPVHELYLAIAPNRESIGF